MLRVAAAFLFLALVIAAGFLPWPLARAADAPLYCFAGDSLANGMAISAPERVKQSSVNVARDGARTEALAAQLAGCPIGATVFVSSGTNDAVHFVFDRDLPRFERAMNNAIAVADKQKQRLVWYAPPRVSFAWDRNAQIISNQIEIVLRLTDHHFVQTRHIEWPRSYRARDGVHFLIPLGYRHLWEVAFAGARR